VAEERPVGADAIMRLEEGSVLLLGDLDAAAVLEAIDEAEEDGLDLRALAVVELSLDFSSRVEYWRSVVGCRFSGLGVPAGVNGVTVSGAIGTREVAICILNEVRLRPAKFVLMHEFMHVALNAYYYQRFGDDWRARQGAVIGTIDEYLADKYAGRWMLPERIRLRVAELRELLDAEVRWEFAHTSLANLIGLIHSTDNAAAEDLRASVLSELSTARRECFERWNGILGGFSTDREIDEEMVSEGRVAWVTELLIAQAPQLSVDVLREEARRQLHDLGML
jgi:hypothetical protein